MPLSIIRQDITKMETDAIVNAANETLLGGGGVDGCIHRAAGKGLLEECRELGGCKTGDAKITKGYNLPCRYVIHTVGPVWHGGGDGEREKLISCYRKSLALAKEYGCKSVAFPLISSGVYGYPKAQALKIAVDTIGDFLLENEMNVYITVFDRDSFSIGEKLYADISQFIDDVYVDLNMDYPYEAARFNKLHRKYRGDCAPSCARQTVHEHDCCMAAPQMLSSELDERIKQIDESFSQMLLRKIDEKGMTDSQCYKKANIDRKLFSKIRSDVNYKPSKPTAIAFAVSLELNLEETNDMLRKAGYALSRSNKFDIIIEYFISKGIYNIFEINEALFAFDQNLLGG